MILLTIEFDIFTWRDIQRICGAVTEKKETPYDMLPYIKFDCADGQVAVTGANAYQLSRLNCACSYMTPPDQITFFLPPIKAPGGTRAVSVSPNMADGHYVCFLDGKGNIISDSYYTVPDGQYIQDELLLKKTQEDIVSRHHGFGDYFISVDTKLLLSALEGMRESEAVVFNFSDPIRAFMIRPTDLDAVAIVLPRRESENKTVMTIRE